MRPLELRRYGRPRQRGAVLMIMIVILVVGVVTALVGSLSISAIRTAQQKQTSAALTQAKDALIGFAIKVQISSSDIACAATSNCPRPGDLPCPDMDNDGVAETSCGDASGSTGQASRLGRLPWKTLGLPDLRDGSGERLWYAVSNNFKNNTRTTCNNSNLTGCLNSDTPGTISVFASDGTLINDAGAAGTGVAAVVIAPGEALQRTDKSATQDRSSAGINDPLNYLEVFNDYLDKINAGYPHTLINEDNANFSDGSSTNGFIQGPIKLLSGLGSDSDRMVVNDQLLVVTQDNIMQPVQKRVAGEVKNCLLEYVALPQNRASPSSGWWGYFPWAANRTSGPPVVYLDSDSKKIGHIPDLPFEQTCSDTGGSNCNSTQSGGMKNGWGATCTLNNSNWWVNWKELVFYSFGDNFRPHLHSGLLYDHVCPDATSCLSVNPPSSSYDKAFVIIVAGKKLTGQSRNTDAEKNNRNNYLEGANTSSGTYEQSSASSTFNDIVLFK